MFACTIVGVFCVRFYSYSSLSDQKFPFGTHPQLQKRLFMIHKANEIAILKSQTYSLNIGLYHEHTIYGIPLKSYSRVYQKKPL